jgi:hypothetical protein
MRTAAKADTDDRAALRDAIASKDQAEQALRKHRSAIGRAEDLLSAAREKLTAAEKAAAAAKAEHAAAIAASVSDGTAVDIGAVRAARAAATDAADELDAAAAACAMLREQLPDFEDAVSRALYGIIAARNAVIAPVIESMVARLTAARAALWENENVAKSLLSAWTQEGPALSNAVERLRLMNAARAPLEGARHAVTQFDSPTRVHVRAVPDASAKWLRDLLTDADAEVPVELEPQ